MKILVTGGAGFVGSSLCLRLKEKYPAYHITALDNLKRRGAELNLSIFKLRGIAFVHGDIRNMEDILAAGAFDVLVEASAEPSVLAGLDSDPTYVINNNLYGAVNCFNACLKYGARLVFLSTSRVYPIERIERANIQELPNRYAFAETQDEAGISIRGISEALRLEGPRSFYGTTKLAAEHFIAEYGAFYGLQAAVTRFGVIAGPRQMGKTDQGVVTLWMAKHFWKQPLAYIGFGGLGKQVRDILHIEDALDLIEMQIQRPGLFAGKVFNAGGGLEGSVSLLEMTDWCARITGNTLPIQREPTTRPADLRIYISDNTKILEETGWYPRRSNEAVFLDIFNWIRQEASTLSEILK